MRTRRLFLGNGLGFAFAGLGGSVFAQGDVPVVAAASDLQFALPDIAAAFTAQTGQMVRLTFGSTGNFARQIRAGAPFQMYLAADESYVRALAADGFTRDAGTLYALGRIVMIVPNGGAVLADGTFEGLRAALAAGQISRFALANPDHAPYGLRAMQALQHQGLWQALQPYLVLGENVSQAAQFALSGSTQGGIIAYSLALSDRISSLGNFALIPAEFHTPLNQRMVLLREAGLVAEAFYAYMNGPAARKILGQYGFALPEG
ncbi:MAG: molybdate ABC transporter substrate-binding protein [Rhodobacteraceae bacterium]|nr:molybdate ABC transporter substrate-binding protein [Paracoccaceae bacterium]